MLEMIFANAKAAQACFAAFRMIVVPNLGKTQFPCNEPHVAERRFMTATKIGPLRDIAVMAGFFGTGGIIDTLAGQSMH